MKYEKKRNLKPIPKEVTLKICNEIRNKYKGKWYTLTGLQCWSCVTFTKGDINKKWFSSRTDYRGCNLVNVWFDREGKESANS